MKKKASNKEFELRHISPESQMGKGLPMVGDVRISLYDHDKMRERLATLLLLVPHGVRGEQLSLLDKDFLSRPQSHRTLALFPGSCRP